jgi:hypothetical protein
MVLIPQKDNGCRITVFVHQRDEALIDCIEEARLVRRPRQYGEGEMLDKRSRSAVVLEALKVYFGLIPDPRTRERESSVYGSGYFTPSPRP